MYDIYSNTHNFIYGNSFLLHE
ncbi:MAG TPA: hypothetical protein DCS73_05715 [Roseburia sp.]|nr:hypothetical protein [Roseburia sp.]